MEKLSAGQAFLLQAAEDLRASQIVGYDIVSAPSTFYMLLQMVFEKLAKAHKYWSHRQLPQRPGHEIADRYFSKVFDVLIRMKPTKRKYYGSLLQLIKELEAAQPSVAQKCLPSMPMLEYPWENKQGEICYPARDLPLVQKLRSNGNNARSAWIALKFASEDIHELMRAAKLA